MGITLNLAGSDALNRQLEKTIERAPILASRKLMDITLDLAGRSAQLAPVDTGDLRNDCHAEINGVTVFADKKQSGTAPTSPQLTATIGYSLPYALRQHEELDYNHPKGGQAKYLEQPFLENEAKYIKALADIPEEAYDG